MHSSFSKKGEGDSEIEEREIVMSATQASAMADKEGAAPFDTLNSCKGSKTAEVSQTGRVLVDTSAPFESVKEAVDRFGGSAVWKSQLKQLFNPDKNHSVGDFELMNVQAEAAQLEKVLIIKERETLEVLKELQETKKTVDSLKNQLDEDLSEANKFPETLRNTSKPIPAIELEGEISHANFIHGGGQATGSPGSILAELGQAKMILCRTSSYLTSIQASIQSTNNRLQEEKALLEKNMEKLSSKRALVSSLDEDLKQMTLKLQLIKGAKCNGDLASMSTKIKDLNSEREQFRQAAEAAKCEVLRLTSVIEQIKVSTKATEIRYLAAKKMEEAAKATEASALAQSKALMDSHGSPEVTLSSEEYAVLIRKAEEAEEISRKKVECAMIELERANQSKLDMITKLEEATIDEKTSKKFLKEAMDRAANANHGKLEVEEALRRWRSEHGQRRRYVHNSTKFKNSCPGHQRRDSRMLDLNGLNMVNDGLRKELKHTLSIGEILSRKLLGPGDDDHNTGIQGRPNEKAKVSLGQILNRRAEVSSPRNGCRPDHKQHSMKRKRFGLVLFSHLLRNERSKRKKTKNSKKNKKRKQVSGTG